MSVRTWSEVIDAADYAEQLIAQGNRRGAANLLRSILVQLEVWEIKRGEYAVITTLNGSQTLLLYELDLKSIEEVMDLLDAMSKVADEITNEPTPDCDEETARGNVARPKVFNASDYVRCLNSSEERHSQWLATAPEWIRRVRGE